MVVFNIIILIKDKCLKKSLSLYKLHRLTMYSLNV